MQILKKRKKIAPILAVLLAVVAFIASILCFLPMSKKSSDKASAFGFEDYSPFNQYRVNIDVVYTNETTQHISYDNYSLNNIDDYLVVNGFSLSSMLRDNVLLIPSNISRISSIYVAIFFDSSPFDSQYYDLYISEFGGISLTGSSAFQYLTSEALTMTFTDFVPPPSYV